jgi:hypothetical protein
MPSLENIVRAGYFEIMLLLAGNGDDDDWPKPTRLQQGTELSSNLVIMIEKPVFHGMDVLVDSGKVLFNSLLPDSKLTVDCFRPISI